MGRARFAIGVMPLLRGEIRVMEATLEGPRIEARLRPDGSVAGLSEAIGGLGAASRVIVDRLVVTGGSAALTDEASGRTLAISGLDLDAVTPARSQAPGVPPAAPSSRISRSKYG